MPLVDTYRSQLDARSRELVKLQVDKSKETQKASKLQVKIQSASQAASKAKTPNTLKMRLRDKERHENELLKSSKKISDIERKISNAQKSLNEIQKKLSKEEEKNRRKIEDTFRRQSLQHASKISGMNATMLRHEVMHQETRNVLEELQSLPEKITVLFLASNPKDTNPLRLDEEARLITDTVRKSEYREAIKFETRWAVQPGDVLQAINELNPTVIHFSGHGTSEDEILFETPSGTSKSVSLEAISQTMMSSSDSIRLIFFNTCHSHNQAKAVAKHVEVAVGMNHTINDRLASIFSSRFYSSIGFGHSVEKAFAQAKGALMMEVDSSMNAVEQGSIPELFVKEELVASEIVLVQPKGESFQ
jgi:hypothetical protein